MANSIPTPRPIPPQADRIWDRFHGDVPIRPFSFCPLPISPYVGTPLANSPRWQHRVSSSQESSIVTQCSLLFGYLMIIKYLLIIIKHGLLRPATLSLSHGSNLKIHMIYIWRFDPMHRIMAPSLSSPRLLTTTHYIRRSM